MNDQNNGLELVEPSALEVMERASIDMQITTARKFPREISRVKNKMLSLATLDQETASGCFYTLPARKGGDGKPIQGPSVRMAEIALACYGHIRAGSRVIANDGKVIVAQGVVHDLENNVCVSVEVRQRITTKDGRTYSEDMQVTASNSACSKALRNATFRVVPLALVKPIYESAKKLAIGDGKTLVQRRAAAVDYFVKMGVPKERIFAALGVPGLEDVTLEHLEVLTGFRTAIADNDTTIDEAFPDPKKAAAGDASKTGNPLANALGTNAATDGLTAAQKEKEAIFDNVPVPASFQAGTTDASDRDQTISDLRELMHAKNVDEARLFDYAKRANLVPAGVDELLTLPTETLAKLKFAVPTVAAKGGAK